MKTDYLASGLVQQKRQYFNYLLIGSTTANATTFNNLLSSLENNGGDLKAIGEINLAPAVNSADRLQSYEYNSLLQLTKSYSAQLN